MTVASPPDRRFRRPPVRPPAPHPHRHRRVAAAVAGGLLLVAILLFKAVDVIRTSPALAVTEVVVTGDTWLSRGEILALLDDLHGANIVTVDLEHWRQRLLGSPWVVDAALRRSLPGTIGVTIAERQPMALARIGGDLYLIDQDARVVDRFGPPHAALDLPIVDGLDHGSGTTGATLDERRAARAAEVLHELEHRPDLAARISQIDVSDLYDVTLLLKDDGARLRVGHERYASRLQTYLDVAEALHEQVPEIDYVDLRFDERVFLKPQAPRTPARSGGQVGRGAARGAPARSGRG